MSEPKTDYVPDVRKYVTSVDEAAVAGIVKHLGIALHSKDSSFVAASDPAELKRVRDGFLKKKLALTAQAENTTHQEPQSCLFGGSCNVA